jgi:hypothetical protein
MKPTESGIVASSAKYSYRFVRDGVPQEYQRYKTFYERFHQQASGVRINFVVEQHEVTAEYLVVMDQRKLDAGQHSELVNQYHAVQIDNDRLGVLFKATGFLDCIGRVRSGRRLPVSAPLWYQSMIRPKRLARAVAMAPLFPFYMMYGCAIGPCV